MRERSGPGHRVGQNQGQNLSPELSSSQENPGWKVGGSATGGESSCSRWGACAAGPRLAPSHPPFSSCSQLLAEDLPPCRLLWGGLWKPQVLVSTPHLHTAQIVWLRSMLPALPRHCPAHHCLSCGLALPGLPLCTPSPVAHPLLGASQPSLTLLPSKSSNTSRVQPPDCGGPSWSDPFLPKLIFRQNHPIFPVAPCPPQLRRRACGSVRVHPTPAGSEPLLEAPVSLPPSLPSVRCEHIAKHRAPRAGAELCVPLGSRLPPPGMSQELSHMAAESTQPCSLSVEPLQCLHGH